MSNGASKVYNRALLDSLKTIKRAHKQLHVVTKIRADATPTALTSRLELYGVLLGEVVGIRSNLVAYLECARAEGQIPMKMECVNGESLQEVCSL
jgi:hypothetical protein